MKAKNKISFCILFLLLIILNCYDIPAQEKKFYKTIDIGQYTYCRPKLNDSSVIVFGTSLNGSWTWKNGVQTYLGSLSGGGGYCTAMGLNNNSVIVGDSRDGSGYRKPVRWSNGITNLAANNPEIHSGEASGINSTGVIVGKLKVYNVGNCPFIYDGSMSIKTGLLNCYFNGINDSNYVIANSDSGMNPFVYHNDTITYLSLFNNAYLSDINNLNHIVGTNDNTTDRAYLWMDGIGILLGWDGWATGINDSDVIVGYQEDPGGVYPINAVVWFSGNSYSLDDLIPHNSGIHLVEAFDINNKGEIICAGPNSGYPNYLSYFYLLVPDTAMIIKPRKNDIWIAGEKDTIMWRDLWSGTLVNILYSTDNGNTYKVTAQNLPGDSCSFIWDVPDSLLSAKCLIKIIDANTYSELAVSEKFKIKPYILTKIDPYTNDFIAYDKLIDRFSFYNDSSDVWPDWWWYENVNFDYNDDGIDPFTGRIYPPWIADSAFFKAWSWDYPDWPSFVRAFSTGWCYENLSNGSYEFRALKRWDAKKEEFDGACFGIAGTNALIFMHKGEFLTRFPGIPNFQNAVDLQADEDVIPVITEIFTHQFGKPSSENIDVSENKSPNQTLGEIKEMFKKGDEVRLLIIKNNNGTGGHALLPYKAERSSLDSTIWWIWIWDCNEPNYLQAVVSIYTAANNNNGSWYYSNLPGWGGNKKFFLEVPSKKYLTYADLLKQNSSAKSDFEQAVDQIEIYNSLDCDINIKNPSNEQIGFSEGNIINEIIGAFPRIYINGSETPPYGYCLPLDIYSIEMSMFQKSKSKLDIFGYHKTFSVNREDAGVSQKDKITYWSEWNNQKLLITNPPGEVRKTFKLSEIIDDGPIDKMYIIRNIGMNEDDSLEIFNVNNDKLKIITLGSSKNYEIELQFKNYQKVDRFLNRNIAIPASSNHIISPNWNDISNSILYIFVDMGNDGIIDDTLRLQNEATGVVNQGSVTPKEYRLEQNFPNPFNPFTTIKYTIPRYSKVSLKIYDVLGMEAAVLVNEEKPAGNYEITWNAGNLPSGVYFYQLRTGSFVETKKMILLK